MLRDMQFTELRHFKQREQHRQNLPGFSVATNHIEPAGRTAHGEHRANRDHGPVHIERTRDDFVQGRFLRDAQHAVDGRQQLAEGERQRSVDGRDVDRLRYPTARKLMPPCFAATFEQIDDFAHLLVLEQAAHQFGARILPRFFTVGPRQQHLRLDAQQTRGHLEIICRFVQGERADARQELLGDASDGNVVNVELLVADERQQKIERAGEVAQLNDKSGRQILGAAEIRSDHAAFTRRGWAACTGNRTARRAPVECRQVPARYSPAAGQTRARQRAPASRLPRGAGIGSTTSGGVDT